MSETRRQFTSVDSSIVKGPIRLRDSRGQNLAADTNSCERLYQALFQRATNIREYESDAKIRPDRRLHSSVLRVVQCTVKLFARSNIYHKVEDYAVRVFLLSKTTRVFVNPSYLFSMFKGKTLLHSVCLVSQGTGKSFREPAISP